jgi:hypothetical protein
MRNSGPPAAVPGPVAADGPDVALAAVATPGSQAPVTASTWRPGPGSSGACRSRIRPCCHAPEAARPDHPARPPVVPPGMPAGLTTRPARRPYHPDHPACPSYGVPGQPAAVWASFASDPGRRMPTAWASQPNPPSPAAANSSASCDARHSARA